jgi:hypothetical protein
MKPSPKNEKKPAEKQAPDTKREPYQTPDIVYEGTITIRAGSPIGGFTEPGNPFN